MELQLDDRFRVVTDKLNFILQELKEVENRKTGEMNNKWIVVGYYGKFEHVLQRYFDEHIRSLDNIDVHNLVNELKQTREHIRKTAKMSNIKLNKKESV